jgi:hypothetical protein
MTRVVGSNYFNDVSAKQCLSATSSNLYNDDRCSTGSYEVDLYFYSNTLSSLLLSVNQIWVKVLSMVVLPHSSGFLHVLVESVTEL